MNPSLAIGTARAQRNRVLFVLAALALLAFPATAIGDEGGGANRALGALARVPGVVAASEGAAVAADGASALVVRHGSEAIAVARDPGGDVTLDPDNGAAFAIGLPGGSRAQSLADGIVVYRHTAAATDTAVQVLAKGDARPEGVRIFTVLYGAGSPSDFEFPLQLGSGETVRTAGRGYVIVNARGEVTVRIAPAWARDATGATVPARFSLDGTTLHLHVDHGRATYPVVADPAALLDEGPLVPPPTADPTPPHAPPTTTSTSTGGDPGGSGAPAQPFVIDVNDQASMTELVSQLLNGGSAGAALWNQLSADVRQAVVEFIQGGEQETIDLPVVDFSNAYGRCRLSGYVLRYRTRFWVTLWTFGVGFYFCGDGAKITYVSDPIVRASSHWGWQYHGTENIAWIGGRGFATASLYVQGKFTACVPYLPCNLKEMHPWVSAVGRADGTWNAIGHV